MSESKEKGYFIHESAYIDQNCQIGRGTKNWHFSHIMKDVQIGQNCILGQNVHVASGVVIGNNVKVQNNISISTGVVIEDDVFCGPSIVFTNVFNPRSAYPKDKNEYLKTCVQKGTTIGANATIICGNDLGRYSFIDAGSEVTKTIPDYALYYGNPARFKSWICECGVKLSFDTTQKYTVCKACNKKYQKDDDKITRIRHR